jgi:hypothetical protein
VITMTNKIIIIIIIIIARRRRRRKKERKKFVKKINAIDSQNGRGCIYLICIASHRIASYWFICFEWIHSIYVL